MSGCGGYTDEMGHFFEPSDEDLDRLLSGMAPAGNGLDDLAALVRDVQSAYSVVADEATEDRHITPIVAAAHLLEPKTIVARRSRRRDVGLPTWRRRTVFGSLFASLTAKIAGVAMATTVAAGGFAAAGALPDSAQTAVANVVEKVGITIPNPNKAAKTQQKADDKVAKTDDKADDKIARTDDEDKIAKTEDKADVKNAKTEDKAAEKIARSDDNNGQGDDTTPVAGEKSVSDDVHEALEGEYESGKDKGAAVSDAADQNRQNDEKSSSPGAE